MRAVCIRQILRSGCAILYAVSEMTIYLDVLLLSNLWADYAMLRAASALTHTPLQTWRGIAASVLGAASALTILIPEMPAAFCIAFRLLSAVAICGAAFGFRPVCQVMRTAAAFLGISVVLCGTVFLLAMLRTPVGWYLHNSVIYADVSLLTLLIGTTLAAGVSVWRSRYASVLPHRAYRLHLRIGLQDFLLPALADTGNTLRDGFSGKPVIVCGTDHLSPWLRRFADTEAAAQSCRGFRMIPVRTVTGTRLLPAFLPDFAAVMRADQRSELPVDALIALADEKGAPVVIPAALV